MTDKIRISAIALAVALGATGAHAATIGSSYAQCDPGSAGFDATLDCGTSAERQNSGNVNLGAADGDFYSLGLSDGAFGGFAVFEVNPAFTGPSTVIEVTNPSKHWEAADVYVGTSFDGSSLAGFDLIGRVDNGMGGSMTPTTEVTFSGVYNFIAFLDASFDEYGRPGNATQDGFDVDSFSVAPVPLPAGVLLLGGALAGMGFARRRKTA